LAGLGAGEAAAARLLVIDDDVALSGLLKDWLGRHGFEVETATDGAIGLRILYRMRPDLVILDVNMPRLDGWEVCRRIRDLSDVPIIMISARADIASRIRGFDLGADDYLSKPFELPELLARIRAILRRARAFYGEEESRRIFSFGDLIVDLDAHNVTLAGRRVELSPTEYRLLVFLVQNRGRVVSHGEILKDVWASDFQDQLPYVKLYVRYLREKLEADPKHPQLIQTERGFGYRFASSPADGHRSTRDLGGDRRGAAEYGEYAKP
jgi:two-component system, OmpR family, KDP operon response regulator KdpE